MTQASPSRQQVPPGLQDAAHRIADALGGMSVGHSLEALLFVYESIVYSNRQMAETAAAHLCGTAGWFLQLAAEHITKQADKATKH